MSIESATTSGRGAVHPIFPGYIAFRIRDALKALPPGPNCVVDGQSVAVETVGDCRHSVTCKDWRGSEYRIDVECTKHANGWIPWHLRPGNCQAERRIEELERALDVIRVTAENLAALHPEVRTSAQLIGSLAKEILRPDGTRSEVELFPRSGR